MEWISVEDRLPSDGECVDVFILSEYGNDRYPDIWFDEGAFWIPRARKATVTHWMPSPEPPTEQEKSE